MNRTVLIGVAVAVVLAIAGIGYYLVRGLPSGGDSLIPAEQRLYSVGANEDIKADVASEYPNLTIDLSDKTLLNTYLNQYDFWNKEITIYNGEKNPIHKFKIDTLLFTLSAKADGSYPFEVGNLGKFGEYYDILDQPGPLEIVIYMDPGLIASLSEEELALRFSTLALSSINFLTQSQSPNSVISPVVPPAPFVKVTKIVKATPIVTRQELQVEDVFTVPEDQLATPEPN